MSTPMHLTQLEEIEYFRQGAANFVASASDALLGVEMEIRRFIDWLRIEQPTRLHQAHIASMEQVAQARAALLRKQLQKTDDRNPDIIEEQKALRMAQRRQEMLEEQIGQVKRWGRQIEQALNDYFSQSRQLSLLLEGEAPPLIDFLDRALKAARGYLELQAPTSEVVPEGNALASMARTGTEAVEPASQETDPRKETDESP